MVRKLGYHESAVEHSSTFNRRGYCIVSLPSTFIKLGPKEQNNSVMKGFERRPGRDEILDIALTHDALGAAE